MFNGGDAQLIELLMFASYTSQKYSKMAEIESKFKFRRGFQKQTCFHYEAKEEVKTLKILIFETLENGFVDREKVLCRKQKIFFSLCPGASTR